MLVRWRLKSDGKNQFNFTGSSSNSSQTTSLPSTSGINDDDDDDDDYDDDDDDYYDDNPREILITFITFITLIDLKFGMLWPTVQATRPTIIFGMIFVIWWNLESRRGTTCARTLKP